MKNNKGIGKYELLTMIVIGTIIIVLVLWYFIGVANRERYVTFRKNASTMKQAIITNANSFRNDRVVYLGEAVTGGFIPAIKSPFSGKNCSLSESKVDLAVGETKVTLKCDNYLIDGYNITTSYEGIPIYKVSDWSLKKPAGKSEKKVLYNCLDGGKEKYDEYVEDAYLLALVNNDYGSDHTDVNEIKNECVLVKKTFYRTKKLIK